MKYIAALAVYIILLTTLPAYAVDTVTVDRDGITTTATIDPATTSLAGLMAAADKAFLDNSLRQYETYLIAPYGSTYKADYYCSATDCGPAFQAAFDAAKASGKGGRIKTREGTYNFATGVNAADADTVIVEGVSPVGMWSYKGTIFQRTANVTIFDFNHVTGDPRACQIKGIHFKDNSAGYTAPVLKYHDAHNMSQIENYFDVIPQAIYADRPWDFWTLNNNFRNCGTGDTKDTACVTIYNGDTDKAAGWMMAFNRFETRPGTSIFSDASGASGRGNDTINIEFNKFEGVDGAAYPAIHGQFWGPRIIGNSVYYADTAKPAIWLVHQASTYSGLSVILGNRISNNKAYGISVSGDKADISGNIFDTSYTPAAHIRIESGSGNVVGTNPSSNYGGAVPMLSDNGTGTRTVNTSVGARTAGKQLTYDANGEVVVSAFDTGASAALQTNGINNGSQTVLNLKAGTNMTLTDNGTGQITLDAASGSTGAPSAATYIVQTTANQPTNAQVLSALASGLLYNTTGTGVLSVLGVGTGANNIVQLNGSSQLPAVSGALLTNLPSQTNVSALTLTSSSTSNTGGVAVQRGNADFATGNAYDQLNIAQTYTAASPAAGSSLRALSVGSVYGGGGTLPTLYGGFFSPRNTGTGTISSLIGLNTWLRNTSTGTVTGMTDIYLQSPSNSGTIGGGGVIGIKIENHGLSGVGSSYGVKVEDQSGSTNNYAIYTGTGKVYHGDQVTTTKSMLETPKANGTCSTSINLDADYGTHTLTLSGACAIGVTNLTAGEGFVLDLTQSSTTAPTFTAAFKWTNGTAPTLSASATKHDLISCQSFDGSTLLCGALVDVR